jgi:hypothetical protein
MMKLLKKAAVAGFAKKAYDAWKQKNARSGSPKSTYR